MVCTIASGPLKPLFVCVDVPEKRSREEQVEFVDEVEINSRSYYGRDASRQLRQLHHDPITVMNTLATINERSASSFIQSPGAPAKDLHLWFYDFTLYKYNYLKPLPTESIRIWLPGQCCSANAPHETSLVQAWPSPEKRHWRRRSA